MHNARCIHQDLLSHLRMLLSGTGFSLNGIRWIGNDMKGPDSGLLWCYIPIYPSTFCGRPRKLIRKNNLRGSYLNPKPTVWKLSGVIDYLVSARNEITVQSALKCCNWRWFDVVCRLRDERPENICSIRNREKTCLQITHL